MKSITIAEALLLRKRLRLKLADAGLAIVQAAYEDENSAKAAVSKFQNMTKAEMALSQAIDLANRSIRVTVDDVSYSLHELRQARDRRLAAVTNLPQQLDHMPKTTTQYRGIQQVALPIQLDPAKLAQLRNQYAREARQMDVKLQAANWNNYVVLDADAETAEDIDASAPEASTSGIDE